MLFYIYSDAVGSTIDITNRCRVGRLSVKDNAEEGSVALSDLIIDDPDGDLLITGHRRLYIYESEAPIHDQVVFYGWTSNERAERGPYRVGAARQWTISLADPNALLNRRIMNGTDANRPAETDLARMLALLGMTELDTISDVTYVNLTASTVAMDAVDYRGQNVGQYIDDCRQASGKNAYVYYSETVGGWGLWYDFASSTEYDSGLLLSNTLGAIDNETCFGYSQERTYLNRDPSRVASGIYLDWDGTPPVYVQDTDTRDAFTAIDWAAPSLNVKSLTKATARANRYLADAATEHDIIHTVMVDVPRDKVNVLKKGQLVSFEGSHLPGYEASQICRVLYRTVMEISEDPLASFEIEMDLDPQPLVCPDATASQTFPALNPVDVFGPASDALGNLHYLAPGVSYPQVPTPFHIGKWHFPVYDVGPSHIDYGYAGASNLLRIVVVGDGVLTIPTTIDIDNSVKGLRARLQHRTSPTDGTIIVDEEQFGVSGDTFIFTISTEEEEHCSNWVDIEADPADGDEVASFQAGYAGNATWVLS